MVVEKVDEINNYTTIETSYGSVFASQRALELLTGLDSVIFDMDGVLVDVNDSFKQCDRMAVELYFSTMGWSGADRLLDVCHIDALKLAGGFNSDWDIGEAVVKFYLFKNCLYDTKDGAMLVKFSPSLQEYVAEIAARGGGLDAVDELLSKRCNAAEWDSIVSHFDRARAERLSMEVYAGGLCKKVYGFQPRTYKGTGLIYQDKPLLNPDFTPGSLKLAVATGRTRGEVSMVVKRMEWEHLFPTHCIIAEDDGPKKPDPGILKLAAERLGAVRSMYIGDTPDDLLTARRYDPSGESMLACSVLTGLSSAGLAERFASIGSDMIADNVNAALAAIRATSGE
jgi:phosphoglycolate phosphatase-like HAD superfamily hydrolase